MKRNIRDLKVGDKLICKADYWDGRPCKEYKATVNMPYDKYGHISIYTEKYGISRLYCDSNLLNILKAKLVK